MAPDELFRKIAKSMLCGIPFYLGAVALQVGAAYDNRIFLGLGFFGCYAALRLAEHVWRS